MERRPLGNSGIEVSALGLGTWPFSGTEDTFGRVDDRESIAAVLQALDEGVNLIDTAPIYGLGHAEEIVGKAIQGRRDAVVLATKCGLLPPATADGLPPRCLTRQSILRECDASLRRLRTDHIDLYQCHWPAPNTPIRETMEALTSLLDIGKIRAIGLSNYGCDQIAAACEFGPVHCLQPPFSLLHRRATEDLIPYCQERDIGILAYGPLAKGLLTGKFGPDDRFTDLRASDPEFVGSRYRRNLRIVAELRELAARSGKTPGQLALNYVVTHAGVTAALVGAKRPSQVVENVGALGWSITTADRARLEQACEDA